MNYANSSTATVNCELSSILGLFRSIISFHASLTSLGEKAV